MSATPAFVSVSKALRLRKALKGEIADLTRRAEGCVSWIEGKAQDFVFSVVNDGRKAKVQELLRLEAALAKANVSATLPWQGREISLAEAIRTLAELKSEVTFVARLQLQRGPQKVATGEQDANFRPVYVTVQWTSAYSEPERVAQLAELRAQCEAMNEALEEANHRTMVALA